MSMSLFSNLSIDQTWLPLLRYLTKTAGSLTKPLRCNTSVATTTQRMLVNSCLNSNSNSEQQCLWCCNCGTATARVHPVHLMNIAQAHADRQPLQPSRLTRGLIYKTVKWTFVILSQFFRMSSNKLLYETLTKVLRKNYGKHTID